MYVKLANQLKPFCNEPAELWAFQIEHLVGFLQAFLEKILSQTKTHCLDQFQFERQP